MIRKIRTTAVLASATMIVGSGLVPLGPVAAVDGSPGVRVQNLVNDALSRIRSGSLGSAPVGGEYTLDEPAEFSVDGRTAVVRLAKAKDRNADLPVAVADATGEVVLSIDSIPTSGSGAYFAFSLRRDASGNVYRLRTRVTPRGRTYLGAVRVDTRTRSTSSVGREYRLPDSVEAGEDYVLKVAIEGTSEVQLRSKMYPVGSEEPAWQLAVADRSASRIVGPGGVGLWWYMSGSGSSTAMRFDELRVAAPVANVGPRAAFTESVSDMTATVDGTTSSDPDGQITAWDWNYGDGTTAHGATPAPHTYTTPGDHTLTLTVTDNHGATHTTTHTITTTKPNVGPRAAFTESVSDMTATVDGTTSSDPDGQITAWDWNYGDGTTAHGATPAPHTYTTPGDHTLTLTVTDNHGATHTTTHTITTTKPNVGPRAAFTESVSDMTATVDGTTSSDPDGQITAWDWNYGDGTTAHGATPAPHTYTTPGDHTLTLTVTDNHGATHTTTHTITTTKPAPPTQPESPGADLPISYDLGSVSGVVRFVAPDGSDSASGSVAAPLKTVAAAVAQVGSGQSGTIVVRGGTYRQGQLSIAAGRNIRIIAYPGELPVFNGAKALTTGWRTEGTLAHHSYTPQPVTDGSGISFTSGQNLTGDKVGKHPDQAWVGSTQLRQVTNKSQVTTGKFWVDTTNSRIYLASKDVAKGNIEASDRDMFAKISGADSTLEGLRITRFSNSADDYGVIRVNRGAHNTTLRNVEIIDAAFQAVQYAGSSPIQGATLENVTITGANWMGVGSSLVDDLTLRRVHITNSNPFGEFTHSPQSGALKTSRNRRVKVLDSLITNNDSHGLWFDQSNVDVDVAGNTITGNTGSSVFFEISDDLLMINNYVRSTGGSRAVKLAGSSGIKLLNNTIVGGADPIGVYVDNRSRPGCADPTKPLCANSYNSDRDNARPIPNTLDWMPRIDLMLNNIITNPTATGYCATRTTLCITASNNGATAPLNTIIHKADPSRGIPQTRIDGNVYTNTTGPIIATQLGNFTTHTTFTTRMATYPINITGLDTHSKTGTQWTNPDGTPTTQLTTTHHQAIPTPTDPNINQYLPPGTRHYGTLTH